MHEPRTGGPSIEKAVGTGLFVALLSAGLFAFLRASTAEHSASILWVLAGSCAVVGALFVIAIHVARSEPTPTPYPSGRTKRRTVTVEDLMGPELPTPDPDREPEERRPSAWTDRIRRLSAGEGPKVHVATERKPRSESVGAPPATTFGEGELRAVASGEPASTPSEAEAGELPSSTDSTASESAGRDARSRLGERLPRGVEEVKVLFRDQTLIARQQAARLLQRLAEGLHGEGPPPSDGST